MQIGDTVNLVRRITNEILEMTLDEVMVYGPKPMVVVYWKTPRIRYKLDVEKNEVLAIDSKPAHRQSMRAWYTISEEHRKGLTELFWNMRKKAKR